MSKIKRYSIGITTFCGHNRAVAYEDTDGFLVEAKDAEEAIRQAKIETLQSLLNHLIRAFQSDDVVPTSIIQGRIKELQNG